MIYKFVICTQPVHLKRWGQTWEFCKHLTQRWADIFLKSGVNVANYLKKCYSCLHNFFKYFFHAAFRFWENVNNKWRLLASGGRWVKVELGPSFDSLQRLLQTTLGSVVPRIPCTQIPTSHEILGAACFLPALNSSCKFLYLNPKIIVFSMCYKFNGQT